MNQVDCCFRNVLERMVILRCFGAESFYMERVVFPFERLCFMAPEDGELEVWSHGLGGPELVDSMPLRQLLSETESQQQTEAELVMSA